MLRKPINASNAPCVSIIVPIYNTRKYMDRCIQSLRNQSLKNIEIILVDDSSPDKAGEHCEEIAEIDLRIKVVHRENGGLGFARNSGLEIATGEYIGFADSDDFVSEFMFEKLYEHAQKYDADISYGTWKRFQDGEEDIVSTEEYSITECKVWSGKDQIHQYLLDRIGLPPAATKDNLYGASVCAGIFRHSIIEDNNLRFVSERQFIAEDIIFDIDIIPLCKTVVHCDDVLYFYRYNPNSLTTSYNGNRFEKNVILYHEMYRRLENIYLIEECFNSMSRYLLTTARIATIQEARFVKMNGWITVKKNIYRICAHEEIQNILGKYEYKKLPGKYQLICGLQKRKCGILLLLLCTSWVKR